MQALPVAAQAEGDPGTGGGYEVEPGVGEELAPGEASSQVVGEVTEHRGEGEKHFRMEDGSFLAVNYGVPVHYTLDGETWEDIDNTLTLQESGIQAAALGAEPAAGIPMDL